MLQFRGIGSTICTLLHRDEPGLAFWDPRKLRFYTQRPRFGTFRVAQAKMLHAMDTGQVMSRASRRAFPSNPSPRSLTCDPAGRDRLRHRGYVLIPQSGTVTYRSGPRTAPTHPPRPLVAQGPRSGPAALPATRVLAAPQTGQSALGLASRRIRFPRTSGARRLLASRYERPRRHSVRHAPPSPTKTPPPPTERMLSAKLPNEWRMAYKNDPVESAKIHRPAQHQHVLLAIDSIQSSHRFVPE